MNKLPNCINNLTTDERVAMTLLTGISYGVSADDISNFIKVNTGDIIPYQQLTYFFDNVRSKYREIAKKEVFFSSHRDELFKLI